MMKIDMVENSLGLYIHIPFCENKCKYCDFLSFEGEPIDRIKDYVKLLTMEISENGKIFRDSHYIDSVFIGGGSPSLLEGEDIDRILKAVKGSFLTSRKAEITIEANPNSFNEKKAEVWLKNGVNRLSLGVQSFDENTLKLLGRIHSPGTAETVYKQARFMGFDNINLDLMFGIPGQATKTYIESLKRALNLGPEHLSFYSLQLEPGTPMYIDYIHEKLPEICEPEIQKAYYKGLDILEKNGYVHYEISNASLEGFQCEHNLKYWDFMEYMGVGLGASSFILGERGKNVSDFSIYKENLLNEEGVLETRELPTKKDAIGTFMFTGLRTLKGIDFEEFKDVFEEDFFKVYKEKKEFIDNQVIEGNIKIDDRGMRITKKGIFNSNSIMSEFIL